MPLNPVEFRGAEVIAGLLTALLALMGFFTPAFKWLWARVKAVVGFPREWRRFSGEIKGLTTSLVVQADQTQTNQRLLRELLAEIRPNGGSSLRDAIDRIEKIQTAQTNRQRVVLSLSQDAYFEADAQGMCLYVNHRWEELTGLTLAESRGSGWLHGITEADRALVLEEWNAAVHDRRPFRLRFRYENVVTGEITPVYVRAVAVNDHKDGVVGYLGSAAILTE